MDRVWVKVILEESKSKVAGFARVDISKGYRG